MDESIVTSKGQVTIPKAVRRELGIRQGSRVTFSVKNRIAEIRLAQSASAVIESGYGMLKSRGRHLPADFDPTRLLDPARSHKR